MNETTTLLALSLLVSVLVFVVGLCALKCGTEFIDWMRH